jgi:hypothetical protein
MPFGETAENGGNGTTYTMWKLDEGEALVKYQKSHPTV